MFKQMEGLAASSDIEALLTRTHFEDKKDHFDANESSSDDGGDIA